jgi:hypothetical protein
MTSKVLFLDDQMVRHDKASLHATKHAWAIVHVYTAQEACAALEKQVFDIVFLDHDLGEDGGCGMDVVDFLVELQVKAGKERLPHQIIIHSTNVISAPLMARKLRENGFSIQQSQQVNWIELEKFFSRPL